jgi:predicted subunit of tRNA(5-methylaminomethyl-2-thiouridylate) methyltransferase
VRKQDLIDFAERSRVDLSAIDAAYWRQRKRRLGLGEGNRIAEELRRHVLELRPDWPSEQERRADFEAHLRLSEMLRSVVGLPTG